VDGEIEPASAEFIAQQWEEHWGLPLVSVEHEYMPSDVEGLAWRGDDGTRLGLVTWAVDGTIAEIVSLHAVERGRGVGAQLMDAAEEELRRRGVRTVRVVTTNDNPRALSFYLRRGYRLVRLHLGAMDRVREAKPDVPLVGNDGIPLLDMWELGRDL
jgi:GNAT superfamily N-acetyltransferase